MNSKARPVKPLEQGEILTIMYCRECGVQIPDNSKFCSNCGHKKDEGERVKPINERKKPSVFIIIICSIMIIIGTIGVINLWKPKMTNMPAHNKELTVDHGVTDTVELVTDKDREDNIRIVNAQSGHTTEEELAKEAFQIMKNFSNTSKEQFINIFRSNYQLYTAFEPLPENDSTQGLGESYDNFQQGVQAGMVWKDIKFLRYAHRGRIPNQSTAITRFSGRVFFSYEEYEDLVLKIQYFLYQHRFSCKLNTLNLKTSTHL